MGFFTSCDCVDTTLWMHHMNADKMHREKTSWELHNNATSYFEQILEATPHETTVVRPLTSHLKNHSSKINKICRALLEKQDWIHKWCFSMDPYTWTCQCWLTSTNIFTSALWGHRSLEYLPIVIGYRNGWGEKKSGKFVLYDDEWK